MQNERRLPLEIEQTLYRVAQEALSNVERHAMASEIIVSVTFMETEVALKIRDNGVGFILPARTSDLIAGQHLGIIGMHERAELIGGDLYMQSSLGKGVKVRLRVKLVDDHSKA